MEEDATKQIDAIIAKSTDWRGATLASLRKTIRSADTQIIEDVKWKKPSKPEGVSVWSFNGNLCIGEMLKNAVRLTFPKGALLHDPNMLFNTRLDSKTVRAIDVRENDMVDVAALQALVREAMRVNSKN